MIISPKMTHAEKNKEAYLLVARDNIPPSVAIKITKGIPVSRTTLTRLPYSKIVQVPIRARALEEAAKANVASQCSLNDNLLALETTHRKVQVVSQTNFETVPRWEKKIKIIESPTRYTQANYASH